MSDGLSPGGSWEKRQVPIDGRRFFSRSPLGSTYFQSVSATCFVGLLYDVYLACSYMHVNGTMNGLVGFIFIGTGFAYPWMTIVLNHRRIQRLYANGELKDVPEGSPLDVALGLAAWGPLQALFYSSGAMIVMEAFIGTLMKRAGS
jgi:hypothetical protein